MSNKYLDIAMDKVIKQEVNAVLNKMRAEIEQLKLHKAQFFTGDGKVCIDIQEVFDIIDKYRESEEV